MTNADIYKMLQKDENELDTSSGRRQELTNLLPCPFCGGPAELWMAHSTPDRPAWVACMGRCVVLVSQECKTTEEAIMVWNTRTETLLVKKLSGLVAKLRQESSASWSEYQMDGYTNAADWLQQIIDEVCK